MKSAWKGSMESIELGQDGLRWARIALVVCGLSALASVALAAFTDHGLERFFRSYLVSFVFFLALGLGALFFVLIGHLSRAGWNVVLRRIAESISLTLLPLSALAFVIFWGSHELYEWTHAEEVARDPLLQHKQSYLNVPFFFARLVFYGLVWSVSALYFARTSANQDRGGASALTLQMERAAPAATILYSITVTFAAFDLVMSLYPHWYSTIFGVYYFGGAVLSTFSVIVILVFLLQRRGKLTREVTVEHYHDLGKFMFAFVVFWAYIGFSQYMLIWYTAIPEETAFYKYRQEGPWLAISLLLLFGHFFAPFLMLMSRHPKRRRAVLCGAAVWLLVMQWFDMYWLVMPEYSPQGLPFHLLDLTCFLALGGLCSAVLLWRMSQLPLLAIGDPRLDESLRFENA